MNSDKSPRLSIIIPAYNEADRIAGTIDRIQRYLGAAPYAAEIVVVDDGSTDDTARIVSTMYPDVRLITYSHNRGKGYAVKRGVQEADGDYRLVYDADGSTPIAEIDRIWPVFDAGASVVIGSRALPESDVQVRQPLYRQTMGRIYNKLLRALRLTSYPDTQCGFKALNAAAADTIVPRMAMDGFGSDCEMLYIAKRHGLNTEQLPVRWVNSPDSRVHAFWDSLDMIREALTIRIKAWLGHYD